MMISEEMNSLICERNQEMIKSHLFEGRHFFASYYDCDERALSSHAELLENVLLAIKATGATLLHYVEHEFEPQGYAAVMLLSESHASIHTYPEHKACFVDIFTCGKTEIEIFDHLLQEYLKPGGCTKKIFCRTKTIQEEPLTHCASVE